MQGRSLPISLWHPTYIDDNIETFPFKIFFHNSQCNLEKRGGTLNRQRVSKGQIIQKKYQKIATIFLELTAGVGYSEFLNAFKKMYPKDWENVNRRYREHELLNKPGKSHPMPRPEKYIEMAYIKVKKELINKTADEYLADLEKEKPDFYDGEPKHFNKLVLDLHDKSDYERRLRALHEIGKYRSEATIALISDALRNDHIFDVQQLAYEKLLRFDVKNIEKPKKPPHHSDPEIIIKLSSLGFSAKNIDEKKSVESFISKFKKTFPLDYDLYRYAKRNQFKHWMKSVLKQIK
jgi:hypothetical protein